MKTWRAEVLEGYLTGRIPFYVVDNGIVVSQVVRASSSSNPRPIAKWPLQAGSDWLTKSLLPIVDFNVIVDDPAIPALNASTRSSRTQSANLAVAATAPSVIVASTFDFSTAPYSSTFSNSQYKVAPINVTPASTGAAQSVDMDQGTVYSAPRCIVGMLVQLSSVAPDVTAGSFPANAGSIAISHVHGQPGLEAVVSYQVKVQSCGFDNTSLFMPFIAAADTSAPVSAGNSGVVRFDSTYMMSYPPFFKQYTGAGGRYLGYFLYPHCTNYVSVRSEYNSPPIRVEVSLVHLDELLASNRGAGCGRSNVVPGDVDTDAPSEGVEATGVEAFRQPPDVRPPYIGGCEGGNCACIGPGCSSPRASRSVKGATLSTAFNDQEGGCSCA